MLRLGEVFRNLRAVIAAASHPFEQDKAATAMRNIFCELKSAGIVRIVPDVRASGWGKWMVFELEPSFEEIAEGSPTSFSLRAFVSLVRFYLSIRSLFLFLVSWLVLSER